MSGVINKVKDALHGEHHHHHHDNEDHSNPDSDSVAHGTHISPTNPGILHSTKPGIHGARDSGTATTLAGEGDESRLTGTTWGAHPGKSSGDESVAHGNSVSPTNPGILDSTKPGLHGQRDTGAGVTPGFEETERRGSELHHKGFVEGAGANPAAQADKGENEEERFGNTTIVTAGDREGNFAAGSGYDGGARGTGASSSTAGSGYTAGGRSDDRENFAAGTGLTGERRGN